ncbi:TrkH family potassium uptake protein [Mobilicoccus caccae]|uniref:Potassium transporter Trk n=1 Tax=Mobilicoccus caccae TaxID=1859295 RepID=A0ABQ6IUA2_9MICO|nr:potassium transporter TrkG [Mobilicoccus caccae]GMA41031.1 potassium transporter Trk [Mobilicoccus caccae]
MANTVVDKVMRRPVRLVPLAFLGVIAIGTLLLLIPATHHDGQVRPMVATFTAVSATCITGLTVVDTATYWTPFGQFIILLLTQMGGFGIMSIATLLAILVKGHIELSGTLVVQTETQTQSLGQARRVVLRIATSMLVAEAVAAVILTLRFHFTHGTEWPQAIWHGIWYAGMSFTNAGFALHSDSIMGFIADPLTIIVMSVTVFAGSIGYPVFWELLQKWRRPRNWSVHTRLSFYGFILLFVLTFAAFLIFEWDNPDTIGSFSVLEKVTAAIAGGVMPRSGGFNIVDYALIKDETTITTIVMMFIGGGSAGTSGGIKVSTFFLLAFLILAVARGERDVTVAHRRIGDETLRQAVTVALLAVACLVGGTMMLAILTNLPLPHVLFDVTSAFGTVGLSMGITPELPAGGQITLMVLMFLGRVGTFTAASALALRTATRHYHLPEERPIVG